MANQMDVKHRRTLLVNDAVLPGEYLTVLCQAECRQFVNYVAKIRTLLQPRDFAPDFLGHLYCVGR